MMLKTIKEKLSGNRAVIWHQRSEWVSKVTQPCPTLCDPMDCSPPGSSVHGIFQARVLEWVAISPPRGIFPTQGSNPGLPHCRQTLPSGAPGNSYWVLNLSDASVVQHLPALQGTRVRCLGWEDPLEEGMATHSSLTWEFHGQRSLAGYSPWGRIESDTAAWLTLCHCGVLAAALICCSLWHVGS